MNKSLLLFTILIVNVLSVVVVIEDLYEEDLPDVVIPSLTGGNFTFVSRSGGSSASSSPAQKNSDENTGYGSEINDIGIKYHINDNETHFFVPDPTNQTEGYYFPIGSVNIPLNASRGQTSLHEFVGQEDNGTHINNIYNYNSSELVNKTGVIPDTDWVTRNEYPNRFVIRLTNGSIFTRETPAEMNTLISDIGDNSTIWAVGYESFEGLLAFYLNFADVDWGQGQYIWYPRLKNGQITAYDEPLYAIYSHLYVNYTGTIYNKILNDKALYDTPAKNPKNTLHFFNTSDTFGISFETNNISILSSNWDFTYGFKYNFTDELYHMINEIVCNDRNFTDVGFAYEITSSPQSDGTPYQPDRFRIVNQTKTIEVDISEAWEAGAYLKDFYSEIQIISQNNETFRFTFSDMELAGFTQKYLNLHNQTFPDGSWRYTLRAGMYGYGDYTNGTVIEIDPSVGYFYTADNYDLWALIDDFGTDEWYNSDGNIDTASINAAQLWNIGFVAFDTNLIVPIGSFSANSFQLYCTEDNARSVNAMVYDLKGNGGTNTAREDSHSWSEGSGALTSSGAFNPSGTGWTTGSAGGIDSLLERWADYRDNNDEYISFKLMQSNDDFLAVNFQDSSGGSNDPRLSFTYAAPPPNTAPVVTSITDGNLVFAGKQEDITVRYTDADGYDDLDDVWLTVSDDNFGSTALYLAWNIDSNTPSTTDYDNVLLSTSNPSESAGGSATGASGYYDITWHFIIDWDTDWNTHDVDYFADCDDEIGAGATGLTTTTTGEEFDDKLEFKTVVYTLSNADYSDDGNTALLTGEWFRGGVGVLASGVVSYFTDNSMYPPTTQVDVELKANGNLLGETYDDDTLGASGQFSITSWATTPTTSYDADFDFDVVFTDWAGNSDSGNDYGGTYGLIQSSRDNEKPTVTDSVSAYVENSGGGYLYGITATNMIWHNGIDSYSADFTITTTVNDVGSGMVGYHGGVDCGAYAGSSNPAKDTTSPYQATYVITGEEQGDTIDVYVYDAVFNVIAVAGTFGIWEDDTDPVILLATESESSIYLYSFYGNDYQGLYGSEMGSSLEDYWIDGTASDVDSGVASLTEDITDGWGNDPSNGGSATSYVFNYKIDDSDDGTKVITYTSTDNVGLTDTIIYTFYEDNVDPVVDIDGENEASIYLYMEYGNINQGAYGSEMPSGVAYAVYGVSSDANGIILTEDDSSFGDNPSIDGLYTDWQFTYTVDAADNGDEVITYESTDNVGNTGTDTYTFYEDNTPPTITIINEIESVDFLYAGYGTITQGVYGSQMSSVEDFLIWGECSDANGMAYVVDDEDVWGNNPSMAGSVYSWTFTYEIDAADNGNELITYSTIDNVGNPNSVSYQFYEDNAAPTSPTAWTHADANSGDGTTPDNGYDDDTLARYTWTGSLTDNYGTPTDFFQYNWLGGGYSSWAANGVGYYDVVVVDDDEGDSDARFRDSVFNILTVDGEDIVIDTDDPSGFTITRNRLTGYIDGYHAYWTGSIYYFNSGENDYFNILINNDGDAGNSEHWFHRWDTASIFETVEDDYAALPDSKDFNYQSVSSGGNFIIYIFNHAGNMFILEWETATDDTTIPNMAQSSEDEASIYLYHEYSGTSSGVYGSQMPSGESYIIGGSASDAASGLAYVDDNTDFGGNPTGSGTTSWSFTYSITAGDDGDKVIIYTMYDRVGNPNTDSYWLYEDNAAPTGVSAWTHSDSNSGSGYDPNNGYDDDLVARYTATGTISDVGYAGIHATPQRHNWLGGADTSWAAWYSYFDITTVDGEAGDSDVQFRDNVMNIETIDGENIVVDDDTPESYTYTYARTTGWANGFRAYLTGTTIYINDDYDHYLQHRINDVGTMGNSLIWEIKWDIQSAFSLGAYENTQLDTYQNHDYEFVGSGTYQVRIVNNAGNYQELTIYTVDDDNVAPSGVITDETESSTYLYYQYGTDYEGVYGSGMGAPQDYTISGTASDGGSGMVEGLIWDSTSFGGNPSNSGTTTAWDFIYAIEASDNGDLGITYTVYDSVGNSFAIAQTYDFYEDNDVPTDIEFWLHYYTGTGSDYDGSYNSSYSRTSHIYMEATAPENITEFTYIARVGYYRQYNFGAWFEHWYRDDPTVDQNMTWDNDFGSHDDYMAYKYLVTDAVGNSVYTESYWVLIDKAAPYGHTGTLLFADGFDGANGDSAYLTGSDLYFQSVDGGIVRFTIANDGTFEISDFWKVQWDYNSVFISQTNDTSGLPDTQDFSYTGDGDGTLIIKLYNLAGSFQKWTYTVIDDITDPTFGSFDLDVDSFAVDPNFCHTLLPNTTLVNPADSGSGLAPNFLYYALNDSFGAIDANEDLTFEWDFTHGILDQHNHTLGVRIIDRVGNILDNPEDWVIVDTIAPIALILSMDEMFAPNFYDQSIAHTANLTVTWTETFPYYVDYSGVLSGSDDTDPSGGSSAFALTISGESNGWYQVNINVMDKAGWSDSVLVVPSYGYGIVQLDSSLGSDEVEIWFYFYFFKESGLGLDWKDYNTSYVVDEVWYPNPTLSRIRGGLFAQKFLNFTSTIRFEVRDFFGNLIHNTSYPLHGIYMQQSII